MKLVKAFIHHVRTADCVRALADAGYRNITLHDVRGMLKPLVESEQDYSSDASTLVISEARLSLVVEDDQVDDVTHLIRTVAKVGSNISGWIYVSAVEKVLPIGGDGAKATAP
jgi:nitrogen regulatory protein PII